MPKPISAMPARRVAIFRAGGMDFNRFAAALPASTRPAWYRKLIPVTCTIMAASVALDDPGAQEEGKEGHEEEDYFRVREAHR